MAGPSWKLEDDLETVTVAFPSNPPVAIKLKVSDVENMLANLGEFRALMKPEIPIQMPTEKGRVLALSDPIWRTEPDAMMGWSMIHIRDLRFGWMHYVLPPHEARKLADALKVQAETVPPVPPNNQKN